MDEQAFARLSPGRQRAHVAAEVEAIIRAYGETGNAAELERLADALTNRLGSYDEGSVLGRSIVSELRRRARLLRLAG